MFSKIAKRLSLCLLGISLAWPAQAKLRIVATIPDLADLTRQVGGDQVVVESLARGSEDIHSIPQRPSFLPKLNRAHGVVLMGLEMEHTFLPALLEAAQNPALLRGRPGYIDTSEKVKPLNVPENLSRSEGEVHPHGNPHYNLDPRQGDVMAETIAAGLTRLDPSQAATFAKNLETFKATLATKRKEWEKMAAPLKGVRVVSHHEDMLYLAEYVGLKVMGTVEPKPGIAPSPKHLEKLAQLMKNEKVPLILREVQYPESTAQWLADRTGAQIAVVATMGNAFPDSGTYIGMIDHNIRAVIEAYERGKR